MSDNVYLIDNLVVNKSGATLFLYIRPNKKICPVFLLYLHVIIIAQYMKAAFLIRCSTDKQDYQRQIEDLQQVAERMNLEWSEDLIFGEYITGKDDVTKGNRRSIERLLEAAKNHVMDVLLIAEVSRLSRDSLSGRYYVRELCNAGIPTYFRDKSKWTINPDTGKVDESFIRELGGYFDGAADYLKSMKTQIASGRRSSLRNNQLIFAHVPIGYKKLGGPNKRTKNTLVVDEEQAKEVIDIFNMYAEDGASLKSVALLISAKYGARRATAFVYQILKSDYYWTGEYRILMKDPDNPDNGPEPFYLKLERPLVSKELFETVNSKLKARRSTTVPYPTQQVHLLSRLIKCPSCGHSFSPRMRNGDGRGTRYRMSNGKLAYTWKCMSRIRNLKECDCQINLNNEKLEGIYWEFIKKELIAHAEINDNQNEVKLSEAEERVSKCKSEIQLYDKEIESANRRGTKAYNAYLDAPDEIEEEAKQNYSATMLEVKRTKEYASARIEELNREVNRLQKQITFLKEPINKEEYIKRIDSNEEEKRKLFVELIYKIVPYKVRYRVVVLETETINGTYYILFDANQYRTAEAYYFDSIWGRWQAGNNAFEAYDKGDYFAIMNPSMLYETEDIEAFLEYDEIVEICKQNDWVLSPVFKSPVSYKEF